jgi:hypothetical protein
MARRPSSQSPAGVRLTTFYDRRLGDSDPEDRMHLFHRQCAVPDCHTTAGRTACQDCGKPFCIDHVSAVDFKGFRETATRQTKWTRFVCSACSAKATSDLAREVASRGRDREIHGHNGPWRFS